MKKVALADIFEKPISGEWGIEPTDKAVNILRTTNFRNDGRLNLTSVVKRDIEAKKVAQKRLKSGDIIIEKSGGSPAQPVGRVVYFDLTDGVYLCNNFTAVLRPKSGVHPKYAMHLLYGLHVNKVTLAFQNKTTGIINLKLASYLSEVEIPLPPLAEQIHIAQVLDQADRLRQQDRQLLAHYDQLVQAVFMDMFGDPVRNERGWPVGTIRDIIIEAKYGTSKPAEESGTYPYLRMNNLTYEGSMDFTSLKYINLDEKEKHKYLIRKGDLLFNRTNSKELVGKTAVYRGEKEMAIAGYLIRVRSNERSNTEYISAFLNSKYGKLTLLSMCKSIVGMANINAQELQDIVIPIPPVEIQNQFAEVVAQIDLQKAATLQLQAQSEALFNSLLQRAFRGELKQPEPDATPAAGQLAFALK